MPVIVGFDTSTADTAVASARDGVTLWESARGPASPGGRPVHVTALLPDIEAAAKAAGGWAAVERIAVGIGPGSFTGLRLGIATARGLAQALGCEVMGVGTLAAIAAAIGDLPGGEAEPRLAVLDARRGEVFAALHGPAGDEHWPAFVASPEHLAERVEAAGLTPLTAGDGSIRFRSILEAAGAQVPPDAEPVHRVSASRICELAIGGPDQAPVEPVYLRRPDAELWREQQVKQKAGS